MTKPVVRKKQRSKKTSRSGPIKKATGLEVREALLKSGKKIFAQKGLTGTSIRDIATSANVNSSMISYYFGGKEGLYKECLRTIGDSRLQFAREILKKANSRVEFQLKLRLFIEHLFSIYLEDIDAGLIIVREYDRTHSPAEAVFKQTFLKMFELLIEYFKEGQKKKFLCPRRDPFTVATLFLGCLTSQMRLNHIKEKVYKRGLFHQKDRDLIINHILELFIH